jgi:hypothetical protein
MTAGRPSPRRDRKPENTQTDRRWRTAFSLSGVKKLPNSPSFGWQHLVTDHAYPQWESIEKIL